jgi:PAS domain S-box-containing protein
MAGMLVGLSLTRLHSFLLFHTLVELTSIAIAIGIFIIFWNSRRFVENDFFLFLSIAYLFIAGVDLLHTLAYKGMGVFPDYDANLPTQLWIIARYLQSISLAVAGLLIGRKLAIRRVFIVYTLVVVFLLATLFYWKVFPDCYIAGTGLTPFKKGSEYIMSLILLASIGVLWQKRHTFPQEVLHWMIISIIAAIGSELTFTFYVGVYDFSNMVGHLLKLLSFYFIYKAFIEISLTRPYDLLFREIGQRESALQKYRDQLEDLVDKRTAELQKEIAEHRQTVEELRASEEYLSHLMVTMADGVVNLKMPERLIEYVNPAVSEIFGYSPDEVLGQTTRIFYADEPGFGSFGQKLRTALAEGHSQFRTEQELIKKNGEQLWGEISTAFIHSDGELSQMISVVRDITERKQAEEELRKHRQHLEELVAERTVELQESNKQLQLEVAERKQMERSLQESEEKYRDLIENMNDTVFVASDEGTLTYVSSAIEALLGYSPPEMIEQHFAKFIHPDDILRIQDSFRDMVPYYGPNEYRVVTKSGEIRWVRLSSRPILQGDHIIGVQGILADITERKQAERDLQESEEKLRSTINSLDDLVFTLDENGIFVGYYQPSTATNLIIPPEVFLGKSLKEILPPHVAELAGKSIVEAVDTDAVQQFDYPLTLGEEEQWFDAKTSNRRNAEGEHVGVTVVVRDITERKQMEAALRENEEKYRLLIENAHEAIVTIDGEGTFLVMNNAVAKMLGGQPQDFIGKTLWDVWPKEIADTRMVNIREVFQTGQGLSSEFQAPVQDGLRWFLANAQPIRNQANEVTAVLTISTDITERKQAEAALRENQRLIHSILDNSTNTIFVKEYATQPTKGHYLVANRADHDFLGIAHGELIGKTDYDFMSIESADRLRENDLSVIKNAIPIKVEEVADLSDGQRIFLSSKFPLFNADGVAYAVCGISTDITKIKRMEELEREQRVLFEALHNTASAINSTLDFQEVLDRILVNVGAVVPHSASNIHLIDENRQSHMVAFHKQEEIGIDTAALMKISFSVDKTNNFRVMIDTGQPILIPDAYNNPGWLRRLETSWIRSHLAAPILVDNETIGFLCLDSTTPDFFTTDHAQRLHIFAQQAALAIKNTQLFEQAQEAAIFEERQRLARDLHDAVSQTLFSAGIIAEMLLRLQKHDPETIQSGLEQLLLLTKGAQAEMRTLLLELRPTALLETNLEDLLIQLNVAFTGRVGIPVILNFDIDTDDAFPPDVKITLYRIAQESLNNITKHADASEVTISLQREHKQVRLSIIDNGGGFDLANTSQDRLGMKILRERAQSIGADLTIISAPGDGTEIVVVWPNPA